ncbi:MAG: T9SS C-terminal target domain-containing protein [Cytophagia bacterium]|nr:T9SS C-terminal target domain-containing protein [Cytophagia bacterium]NBW35642.1 T9SS C-terminal target domain-containing protein [Cytophagia bacterium]
MMMRQGLAILLLVFLSMLKSVAQNNSIFNGGSGDGFSMDSYLQPAVSTNNPIFNGGIADGFSVGTYLQSPPPTNNAIFNGGASDGFAVFVLGGVGTEVPLPVELTFFRGEHVDGLVYLYWRTASEMDNDFFDVERMADDNFETIGRMPGRGTINIPTDYCFVDKNSDIRKLYYRLRQVDFSGASSYSKIIKIEWPQSVITLFPNPSTTGEFYISKSQNMEGQLSLSVVNQLGVLEKEIILSDTNTDSNILVPVKLADGLYTVIIRLGTIISTQRLLVNRQ